MAAACAPDCSGRWSAAQGRGTAAGCACAEARRAQHLPAGCGGAAGSPRGPSQIHAPRLHAARGAEPDRRVFRAAKQARIRSRNVSTPSALAVASELGVAAGTNLSEDMRPPAPVGRWAAARAGGQPRLTLKIAEQSLRRLGAAAGELHEVYRAGLSQVPARADVCGTHHTNFHRLGATTAAASRQLEAGSSYRLIGAWTASAVRSSRSSILALLSSLAPEERAAHGGHATGS